MPLLSILAALALAAASEGAGPIGPADPASAGPASPAGASGGTGGASFTGPPGKKDAASPAGASGGTGGASFTGPPGKMDREPVGALIRRSMAAYGGERAQVRMGMVRVVGQSTSPLHPGQKGTTTRVFKRSSRLRLEVAFPGGSPEVRVLDGARAFRYGEPAPAPVAAMLQLQAARLDLPALFLEWEQRVMDQGELSHEGRKVRVLGLEIATGSRVEAGIDPASGRILYVRCLARSGPRELEQFTVYRDFRPVDGVLVPFREEGWANGEPTGDLELTSVEFPDDIPDGTFEP